MNLLSNHLLRSYTTYQIGGPADFFVDVHSEAEFLEAIAWAEANHQKYFVFGGGSNLIFADEGFRGLVIHMKEGECRVDGEHLKVDAGVRISTLVKAAAAAGLTGLEAWNGLPGTVGGAVRGNAGCFGVETKDILESARIWREGELMDWGVADLQYAYRESRLKHEAGTVLAAIFRLKKGDTAAIEAKMKEVARQRIQKQPPGLSTGSFFKNPVGDHAGRLIEAAACKGRRVGGAEISTAHANFLVNRGGATAKDVLTLATEVADEVQRQFGIRLEREVQVIEA